MSLSEVVPTYWKGLKETDDDVQAWTASPHFPDTLPQMLQFIHTHHSKATDRMLDSSLPQSFVHWWCNVRTTRRSVVKDTLDGTEENPPQWEIDIPPRYPNLLRWHRIIAEHHQSLIPTELSDTDVITVFITWMGQLQTDIVLFDNEEGRATLPRLQEDTIKCGGSHTTRRQTIDYIKKEGALIFKERGFKEGVQYWNTLCTKYI